jgi:hypothetical protein
MSKIRIKTRSTTWRFVSRAQTGPNLTPHLNLNPLLNPNRTLTLSLGHHRVRFARHSLLGGSGYPLLDTRHVGAGDTV